MQDKLYAFWKYDVEPFLLGAEVEDMKGSLIKPKGYTGWFTPVKIVPFEKGVKLHKKLKKAEAKYKKIVKDAKADLQAVVKEISQ